MTETPQDALGRERGMLLERATSLHRNGQYAEAEELYRRLLDIDPNGFDAVHRLGILKLHVGAFQEAQRLLEKAVALAPASAAALSNLGTTLLKSGQFAAALAPQVGDFNLPSAGGLSRTTPRS